MTKSRLPEGFSELEPYVDEWSKPEMIDRLRQRTGSSMESLKQFYATIGEQIDQVMVYLNGFPSGGEGMSPADLNLYHMAKSFMEVSLAVDFWDAPDEPGVFDYERLTVTE